MKWIATFVCLTLVAAVGCKKTEESSQSEAAPAVVQDASAASEPAAEKAVAAAGAVQTVCPVSGEELGSMGDPIIVTHAGQSVQLCCKSCVKTFNADPEKYLAKLNDPHAGHEGHDHSGHDH
jgi:hypothetical protein